MTETKSNIYTGEDIREEHVSLEQAVEITGLSRTTIRKLVNDGVIPQKHFGVYKLKDLVIAAFEFAHYGHVEK